MAKKLIYTTVEIITPTVIRFDITIPANKTEYFHILSEHSNTNTTNYTEFADVYNQTSESVTVEKIKNGEIIRTYTVKPHETYYRIELERNEYIRLKEFKNYEDAIFVEWPKS